MKCLNKNSLEKYSKIKISNIPKIKDWESIQMYAQKIAKMISPLIKDKYIDVSEIHKINNDKIITLLIFKELSFLVERFKLSSKKDPKEICIFQNKKIIDIDLINILSDVRKLQDMPQNFLTPDKYSKIVLEKFGSSAKILSNNQTKNMNLFHAVGDSSPNKPKFLVIKHQKDKKSNLILLIGKGVTYDAGGYNLKNGKNLLGMKADMSGSAVIYGVMSLLEHYKMKKNVIALIPMVENIIGDKAIMPQMVISSYDKTFVEIKNTDAEGRLINADAISYGLKKYNPRHIIEVSTLVGSITQAISNLASGAFSYDKELIKAIKNSEKDTGERFVVFDNFPEIKNRLYNSSSIGDIANVDLENKMSFQYAFEFLNHFAKKNSFMHIDIAGTAVYNRDRGTAKTTHSIFEAIKKIS